MQSIRIILDDHRSLTAVMHGMLRLIRDVRLCGAAPDFEAFESMTRYLDAFVERFHHPKEDVYLFRWLRARHGDSGELLDRLHAEHGDGSAMLRELEAALADYKTNGEFTPFAQAAQAYAAFHYAHMRAEDDEVLPLARLHLRPSDWREIDDGLTGRADARLRVAAHESDELFRRVVAMMPPPLGKRRARAP